MGKFLFQLFDQVLANGSNQLTDNVDTYRFGQAESVQVDDNPACWRQELARIEPYLDGLERTYALWADDASRRLMIQLFAFRILGNRKVRLPLSHPGYLPAITDVRKRMLKEPEVIPLNFLNWKLGLFDLGPIGYPIRIYFTEKGVHTIFVLDHYRHPLPGGQIGVEPGDWVIDGGGCWGDSALQFAHRTGPAGRVFSFEILPDNQEIFQRNMALNPELSSRVRFHGAALWNVSDQTLAVEVNGPGSSVMEKFHGESTRNVKTVAIDDLVAREGIEHLDFIKMDIEGAELNALKGARMTLERFRPKLAISVYHKLEDWVTILDYLSGLDLGYEFYLGHFSIHLEESILFARCLPGHP
ncbi:MAG TPA: FkbM family methyltransferase [Candidatus Sumerlaeota bacterium]|nr:FkbM family methyltransferase [Candidatus Sumerlaeota bacterium]